MSQSVLELTSLDQVAALVHPVRRRILAELVEPSSPAEVARRVGMAAQLANYHVRTLEGVGLAERVESRQRRNLIEHRFRAVARSFTLSSALPLSDEQRALLQQDVAVQELIQTGDAIRNDALALLHREDIERHLATLTLDVALRDEAERAAFVRAVLDAVRHAAAPYRAAESGSAYRLHLAVYPAVPAHTPPDQPG
ncbi:MAG TPA: helix-turn-helix domain-containing protein [Chloroflexota bacterium]